MNTIKHVVGNIIIDSKGILYKTTLNDKLDVKWFKSSESVYFIENKMIWMQSASGVRGIDGKMYVSHVQFPAPFRIKKKIKEKDYTKYLRYII